MCVKVAVRFAVVHLIFTRTFTPTFMMFSCKHNILCSRWCKDVYPVLGIKELSSELRCEVLICESWGIVFGHKEHIGWNFLALPIPPVDTMTRIYSNLTIYTVGAEISGVKVRTCWFLKRFSFCQSLPYTYYNIMFRRE